MKLSFSAETEELIKNAKKEMFELKHPYVGSEHLLLAILNNGNLKITKILNSYDITYENFRHELINSIGIGSKSNEWFLFTPILRETLDNAFYYAEENLITPYSLLVSLLNIREGIANRILICLKIDLETLLKVLINDYER